MWQIEGNKFSFSMTESIEAPKSVVYTVLADFESYPDFISDIVSATPESGGYRMVVKAAILTIPSRIRVAETPGSQVSFEMVEGPIDSLTGSWQIEDGAAPGKTNVTLNVDMAASEGSRWLIRMAGSFVQSKTGKLVEAFRSRIEAVHRGEVTPAPAQATGSGFATALKRLWQSLTGPREGSLGVATKVFDDPHEIETLDVLAGTMIPADGFDDGAKGLGFPEVAEVRARYEAGRAKVYRKGLQAVDVLARSMFSQDTFVDLSPEHRLQLLDAVRQGKGDSSPWEDVQPGDFFGALWEDVLFLYCTHPDTWQRLGWPGPAFDAGGYIDFDQEQKFMGKKDA
jgi:ribosome-associated toxin RatA of RatAB toxin-antitoxin module